MDCGQPSRIRRDPRSFQRTLAGNEKWRGGGPLGCGGTFYLSPTYLGVANGNDFQEEAVDALTRPSNITAETASAVSWGSIAAGGVAAAALSLALLALGTGLGLTSISPWGDSGVSASTFKNATGAYLVIVAVMSSAIGGYLAARLRTKWTGLHTNEVFSATQLTALSPGRSQPY
jgi:hypothetical protein